MVKQEMLSVCVKDLIAQFGVKDTLLILLNEAEHQVIEADMEHTAEVLNELYTLGVIVKHWE